MTTATEESGRCFNCNKPVGEDYFCSGCKSHVCDECDVNYEMPFGGHDKKLHLEEPEDE